MNDYKGLLPRDKHDFERVEGLYKINRQQLISLIPLLLEWLQDSNWPIADEVARLLLTVQEETVSYVRQILIGNDELWKNWCMELLVKKYPPELKRTLIQEMKRIADHPTPSEEAEEVH